MPAVAMAHGLSGTRRDGLGPFADRFAAAGIAALVFDHRGLGDSGGEPDRFEPGRQLEDWHAAITRVRTLPGIEESRWRNRISSRWLLGRPYRPGRLAARLHCPWLLCVGEADPGVDHFDVYGAEFEAVVADEIEFLRRHLL